MNFVESLKSFVTGGASSEIKFSSADIEVTLPKYVSSFKFENQFDQHKAKLWFDNNWTLSFLFAAAYVLLIFVGKRCMAHRTRFELRGPLTCWNLILAAFSICGALRTLPELIHILKHNGLDHSICVPSYEYDKVAALWGTLFSLSKVIELGDTVFIILRKQPLIFLHYYHHATVLIYTWYGTTEYTAPARWFIAMNYTVHSFMYTYYALKAMQFKVPSIVSMFITTLQISQMIVAVFVNIWAYLNITNGAQCHLSELNVRMSFLMYLSYFILFALFFRKAYFGKSQKKNQDDKKRQ